jgi:hypothetical protein
MFINLRSIFTLILLCVLIVLSIPSYTGTASYAQDNTTVRLTSPQSRNVLETDNSTLSADLQSKLVAKDLEDTLRDGVSVLELMTNNSTPMTIPPN